MFVVALKRTCELENKAVNIGCFGRVIRISQVHILIPPTATCQLRPASPEPGRNIYVGRFAIVDVLAHGPKNRWRQFQRRQLRYKIDSKRDLRLLGLIDLGFGLEVF